MNSRHLSQSAFSLVELSIVLVILGLLVGGVLSGRSLIRAAELRSVTTEYSQWVTAINTFRQKYNAMPGDMPNAQQFWGALSNCSTLSANVESLPAKETCNGNGQGTLEEGGSASATVTTWETLTFWQHLSNAGLIEGRYTGYRRSSGNELYGVIGQAIPASKFGNAGWSAFYAPGGPLRYYSSMYYSGTTGRNTFFFWNPAGTASASLSIISSAYAQPAMPQLGNAGVLSAEEAWQIDSKIDDGKPDSGSVYTLIPSGGALPCVQTVSGVRSYNVSASGANCMLVLAF